MGSENGDLTRKLDIHSGDELEILGSGLNKLLDRVQYIINNIAKGTDNINESMTSIGNVMSDAEAKVTLINDDMNNMVAATEEIAASTATAFNEVTEFCQGTEKIAELTEKNTELAKKINNISESAACPRNYCYIFHFTHFSLIIFYMINPWQKRQAVPL